MLAKFISGTVRASGLLPWWLNPSTVLAALMLGMVAYIGIQKIELLTCRLHSKDMQSQLEKISNTKNEQKQTTDRNVVETRVIIRDSGKVAERIEKAPTAPNCKTPPEIMGSSDL